MFVPFDQMPDHARIWIYQVNRELTSAEKATVSEAMKDFCSRWQVHGQDIPASYQLEMDHFLILAVDESQLGASGCSIDSSVHALKTLQSRLGVDFFNRLQIAFIIESKVQLLDLTQVREKLASGVMNGLTLTFNNQVATKGELYNNWKVPVKDSWLARYLPKGALA